jgi:hypothetical protein
MVVMMCVFIMDQDGDSCNNSDRGNNNNNRQDARKQNNYLRTVRFITAQLSKYEEKENTVWFLVLC